MSRNDIFHSNSMELEDTDVNTYIDDMIELLEDEKEIKHRQESVAAVKNLQELKQEDFIISTTDEAGIRRVAMAAINEKKRELEQTIVDATNELRTEAAEGKRKLRGEGLVIKSELEQKRKKIRKEVMMKNSELEQTGQNIEMKLTIREDESKKKLEKKGKDIVKQLTKTRVETEEKLGYKLQESKAQLESHKNMIESSMTSTAETIKEAVTSKKKEVSQMPDRNQLQLPKEITDMDDETVKTYIRALEKGKTKYNSIRIMVVGHFKVGKTTLVKRLFGQFKDEESTPSTNGIETHIRQCNVNLNDENEKKTWKPLIDGNHINWKQVLSQRTQSITADDARVEKIETTSVTQSDVEQNDSAIVLQSGEEAKHIVQEKVPVPVLLPKREEEQSKEQHKLNQQECVMRLVQNMPKDLGDNTSKINISVWDFAGQYAFYNTHQVFLARRAIYLIVTDMSKDIKDEVNDTCYEDSAGARKLRVLDFARFWLNSIHEFCQTGKKGEPPVLLVGTFADEYAKKENIDQTKYPEVKKQLENKYFYQLKNELTFGEAKDHLLKHFMIDNTCTVDRTSNQFEELKKEILEISKNQSYIGDLIPTKFLLLEEALNKKRKEGTKILNKETDFSKCNEELSFKLDEKEVDVFLRFYHEVGSIIYFNENTLKDYILLEPQWLIDAFKELITTKELMPNDDTATFEIWKQFNETAVLKKDLIDKCWENKTISERTLLLEYMEKLGLIVKDRETDSYFAPCVLKQAPSERLLKLGDINKGECPFSADGKTFTSKLCYTTKSKFIPMAIFNRLLADCISRWGIRRKKNHENGEERVDIYCGCGIFNLQNAHILYVHFRDNVVQIWIVRCSKKSPLKEICLEVKKHMDDFFGKVFKKCEVELHFSCPTGPSLKDAMYPHDKLKSDSSVYCDHHEHELPSLDLTGCWFSDDRNDGKQELPNGCMNFKKTSVTSAPLPSRLVIKSAQVINSVGVFEGGTCTGTIFRVGKRFGMTAAHVIDSITNPHNAMGHDDLNQLTHCSVLFGEPKQLYRLKPVLHFKDRKLDVAIVEFLDGDLPRLPPPLQLVKYDVSATLKAVAIIGRHDPEICLEHGVDVKQQDDIPTEKIKEYIAKNYEKFRTVLKILGSSADFVDEGYRGYEADTNILLNCVLGPGASGSPVFTEFQESLKVVGLFICGYPRMYYEFPKSVQNIFPLEYTFEAATKTNAIYKALCKHNKEIGDDIFGC